MKYLAILCLVAISIVLLSGCQNISHRSYEGDSNIIVMILQRPTQRLALGALVVLTIVENDEIDTYTIVPSIGSEKRLTHHSYSPEELEVQLLRGFPRIDPLHPSLADCVP